MSRTVRHPRAREIIVGGLVGFLIVGAFGLPWITLALDILWVGFLLTAVLLFIGYVVFRLFFSPSRA